MSSNKQVAQILNVFKALRVKGLGGGLDKVGELQKH